MSNLDIIARMAMNGWPLIPAMPGDKQTFCHWGAVNLENYKFSELFAGYPFNSNCAILTDSCVTVIDFDNHGPEPNGATAYRRLEEACPGIFDGSIVELTQSGGVHVYYHGVRNTRPYTVPLKVDNAVINVEVLTGRKLCYCYPSMTKKGRYVIISKANFLNSKPEGLPPLPEIFKKPPEVIKELIVRPARANEDLSSDDVQRAIDYFTNEARYSALERHNQARAMCRCLAGLGLSEIEIARHAEDYIRRRGREPEPKEAENLAKYGIKNPLDAKPWKAILENRRIKALQHYEAIKQNMRKV